MIRKVYKFGGASVKDAAAVRNLASIVSSHSDGDILLVVSAMGKTTNMLESILAESRRQGGRAGLEILDPLVDFHLGIMDELFSDDSHNEVFTVFDARIKDLYTLLSRTDLDYDCHYDQTVSFGELLSTLIVAAYLNRTGLNTRWLDARRYVVTDHTFRSATVDWAETGRRIKSLNLEHTEGSLFITQGFIGSSADGKHTTTLGREGSDYSAAIFANCLNASEVTIWKDVDGLLNADPKRFPQTVKIPHISYPEAIELAFYGATVIHPKTMKPLQNKNIALHVRSFIHPENEPTVIDGRPDSGPSVPSYIVKDRQTLVSFSPRDYSFMNEHNLKTIFAACDSLRIHANMIQTSALMLSLCIDSDENRLSALIDCLREQFSIKYNEGLQLFTVRHRAGEQPSEIETEFMKGKKVIVKQGSRSTLQFVLKTV